MAKNRLILEKKSYHSPVPSFTSATNPKKPLFKALLYERIVFFFVASFYILSPFLANASLFSFVSAMLSGNSAQESFKTTGNSQNMSILQAALNSDPNPSKGGGDITIVGGVALLPETGPTGTLADIQEQHSHDQISVYVVRKGDTLSQIAKMFGVSTNTIIWGNDLKSSIISEGQTLIILPVSGVRHTVKSGDTIQSIAKFYKGDVSEILSFNNLSSNQKLTVGEIVIVPDGEVSSSQSNFVSNTPRGTSVPSYDGYYTRPLVGGKKTQGLHGYNGIDLGAPSGTPIYAAASGNVIISRNYGWNGGYGNYVVISHTNGTQTLYAHLTEAAVFAGAYVYQGQIIGYLGSTGKSTGPHVHFEVRGAKNPF